MKEFLGTNEFDDECKLSSTSLPDDNRVVEPPDTMPNSDVKRDIADGSVGLPHVRVGHCQAFIRKTQLPKRLGFFMLWFLMVGVITAAFQRITILPLFVSIGSKDIRK